MCGIVGAAGNLNANHEKLIRTLLILDCLRGEDSTGVAVIDKFKGAEVDVAKQVGDPFQLFNHRHYENAMRGSHRAIIGHNRYATVGGVNHAGAHPFENASLVGVHNGTLTNKHSLADAWKFRVDSENLFHHIDKHGLDDAYDVAEGAWSLVWWDKDDHTLNFLRNKERPMYICYSANNKGERTNEAIFWASEDWMLDQACWKAGVGRTEIFSTEVDTLYSIGITDGGVLQKPTLRRMPVKVEKVPPFRGGTHTTPLGVSGGSGGTVLGVSNSQPLSQTSLTLVETRNDVINKTVKDAVATKKQQKEPPKHVSSSVSVDYDGAYLKAKNHSFELLLDKVDEDGYDYILCHDPSNPYKEVRLYALSDDKVWDHIPDWIRGSIQGAKPNKNTPGKVYYMINPVTLTIVDPVPTVFAGQAHGYVIKDKFDDLKLTCNWCTSPLQFGDKNRFTKQHECFCPDCAGLKEVEELVNFAN